MRLKFWLCSHPKRTRPWSGIRQTVDPSCGLIRKLPDKGIYETCLSCGQELAVTTFTGPLDIQKGADEKTFFCSVEELL